MGICQSFSEQTCYVDKHLLEVQMKTLILTLLCAIFLSPLSALSNPSAGCRIERNQMHPFVPVMFSKVLICQAKYVDLEIIKGSPLGAMTGSFEAYDFQDRLIGEAVDTTSTEHHSDLHCWRNTDNVEPATWACGCLQGYTCIIELP